MSCLTEFKRVYTVAPGTPFNKAVKEAMLISRENNCIVTFTFNGIEVWIFKDSTLSFTSKQYEKNYRLYYKLGNNQKCLFKQTLFRG
jgi:hypothetical protein